MEKRDDLVVLIVEDDGIGFNLKDKMKPALGLTGMNERAAVMGGTLVIESSVGKGTTVFVRIQTSAMQNRITQS